MTHDAQLITHFYPEYRAGGFTRSDGSVAFFLRVNALLEPGMTVLDYGAGRAEWFSSELVEMRHRLRLLKGKVRRVIGVDIDSAVLGNPTVDQALVVGHDAMLPFEDRSIDLVLADHAFEHVASPPFFAREIDRVLKPGGWVCARTPNRWGYIAVGARLVPNQHHMKLLNIIQRSRKEADVFPTVYRMNTRSDLKQLFPVDRYDHAVYAHNPEPAYFGGSRTLWWLAIASARVLPEALGATLHIFLQKK